MESNTGEGMSDIVYHIDDSELPDRILYPERYQSRV